MFQCIRCFLNLGNHLPPPTTASPPPPTTTHHPLIKIIRRPLRLGVLEYPSDCSDHHMTICHKNICPYGLDRIIICPSAHMVWTVWLFKGTCPVNPVNVKPRRDTYLLFTYLLYLLTTLTVLYGNSVPIGHMSIWSGPYDYLRGPIQSIQST